MEKPTDDQLRTTAQHLYQDEGEIEFDHDAAISRHDDSDEEGAYVQAWVWVRYDEVVAPRSSTSLPSDRAATAGTVKICPKCFAPLHQCTTGEEGCLHCDDTRCGFHKIP